MKDISTDPYNFLQSVTTVIGAGTLEIILVAAITANYFHYIIITEPLYKYIMILLLGQTLGIPFLVKRGTAKIMETCKCPYCGTAYSITGYECKVCGYDLPKPKS